MAIDPTGQSHPRFITAGEAYDAFGPGINSGVAYVDPSGDDTTAKIGNQANKFATIQAAITAFEQSDVAKPVIDIGSNSFSENISTSLNRIEFTGYKQSNYAFHDITFIGNNPNLILVNCSCNSITAAASGGIHISVDLCGIDGSITNPDGNISINSQTYIEIDGDITTDFNVSCNGLISMYGAISCTTLHIQDSRVLGTNSASSTVITDAILTNIVFPDSDPHVAGAGYWVAGVLTKSAG